MVGMYLLAESISHDTGLSAFRCVRLARVGYQQSSASSYSWHWSPGVVQHRPGWVSEPTVADLRVVTVGRISYKFVIVYRSAIAGGFINPLTAVTDFFRTFNLGFPSIWHVKG